MFSHYLDTTLYWALPPQSNHQLPAASNKSMYFSTIMIFHHFSPLEFVSTDEFIRQRQSCITVAFPCCLSLFFFFALSICLLEKATCPRGNFVISQPGRGSYECCVPFRVTHASRTLSIDRVRGFFSFFFSRCFELMKVLWAFYKGGRGNKGSWSGVLPRE